MKIATAIACILTLAGCDSDPCSELAIIGASQQFVLDELRAPSTANFNAAKTNVAKTGDCEFIVSGPVDSQNGFGAIIRSEYFMTVSYSPSSQQYRARNILISAR